MQLKEREREREGGDRGRYEERCRHVTKTIPPPPCYLLFLSMQIFAVGLSQTLTDALRELTVHTPALIPLIQQKLLDLLSQVLANKPFSIPKRGSQLSNTTPTQPVAFVIHPFPPPNNFF